MLVSAVRGVMEIVYEVVVVEEVYVRESPRKISEQNRILREKVLATGTRDMVVRSAVSSEEFMGGGTSRWLRRRRECRCAGGGKGGKVPGKSGNRKMHRPVLNCRGR